MTFILIPCLSTKLDPTPSWDADLEFRLSFGNLYAGGQGLPIPKTEELSEAPGCLKGGSFLLPSGFQALSHVCYHCLGNKISIPGTQRLSSLQPQPDPGCKISLPF